MFLLHLILKTTTEMVNQGMGDLLSIFNKCSLKKERSDAAGGACRKRCESPIICQGCHSLYDFPSSHKGYMATKMKSSLIWFFFFIPQPFSITKNEDCDESCLQLNIKHKTVFFSEH